MYDTRWYQYHSSIKSYKITPERFSANVNDIMFDFSWTIVMKWDILMNHRIPSTGYICTHLKLMPTDSSFSASGQH